MHVPGCLALSGGWVPHFYNSFLSLTTKKTSVQGCPALTMTLQSQTCGDAISLGPFGSSRTSS